MTTATEARPAVGSMPAALADTIETLRQLSSDPSLWDTLPSSDGPAPYLPWHTVTRLLDAGAPGWECDTVAIHEAADTVTVTVRLTVRGIGRCASYQQRLTGKKRDGGTFLVSAPLEKAERRALARAAGLFGCGAEAPYGVGQSRRSAPARRPATAGAGQSAPGNAEPEAEAPTCGKCGQRPVGRKRDGTWFDECLPCSRAGGVVKEPVGAAAAGNGPPARPRRPADAGADTCAMIERLKPEAGPYTEFLRRMQSAGAADPERRYLWDLARYHGLDFDQAAGEFVAAAGAQPLPG